MSDTDQTPEQAAQVFDNIVNIVREAQRDGRAILISSAKELPNAGLSITHARANLDRYGMAMAMLADMLMLVSAGTGNPLETVITDAIRAVKGIQAAQDAQAAQSN